MTARQVQLPGRGTTFVRELAGPPGAPTLLLLHGLGATAGLNWGPSFEDLSRAFRVVAIDHRGHGRGIEVESHFRLADCADDAAALADALELERFIAVGYSMGGPIAQLTWHRHRDRVIGLVLCATMSRFASTTGRRAARFSSGALNIFGRVAPRRSMRRLGRSWLADAIPDEEIRARILEEMSGTDLVAVAQAATALGRFSSQGWIGDVDVPTAVVLTENDDLVPPSRQLQMAEAIPGATVHRVDGNHRVCAAQPHLFVPALLEACASVAARAS
jgi:3-oxoadipate enol-lactonase